MSSLVYCWVIRPSLVVPSRSKKRGKAPRFPPDKRISGKRRRKYRILRKRRERERELNIDRYIRRHRERKEREDLEMWAALRRKWFMEEQELKDFFTPDADGCSHLFHLHKLDDQLLSAFLETLFAEGPDDILPFLSPGPIIPPAPPVDWGSVDENEYFDDEGHYKLSHLPQQTVDDFVSNPSFDPLKMWPVFRSFAPIDHVANVRAAVRRANLWMLEAASRDIPLRAAADNTYHEAYLYTPAVMDSGASHGLTPFIEDFIHYEEVDLKVRDVTSESRVKGMGIVLYRMKATNGQICYLPCIAYHLPQTDVRLISPQSYHQKYFGRSELDGKLFTMHLAKAVNGHLRHSIEVPIDPVSNIPLAFEVACTPEEKEVAGSHFRLSLKFQHHFNGSLFGTWSMSLDDEDFGDEVDYHFSPYKHICCPCVTTESNMNLSVAQKEVLLWHFKLGCSRTRVQWLMKQKIIPTKAADASTCSMPSCATCELAQAKVRKPESQHHTTNKKQVGALVRDKYKPGDFVSMDTVPVSIPGRTFEGYGKSSSSDVYRAVTIFHDAGSGVIRAFPQFSETAGDTLLSKKKFEEFLWLEAGVVVKHYHSDQGVFTSEMFKSACSKLKQTQSFSGTGNKRQNGAAERSVKTLFWMARSFLLHAAMRWSSHDADDPQLWPQALVHAEWLYNRTPAEESGTSPLERLTERKSDHRDLLRSHVWGCPTYVLDAALQDGKKIPKFNRRARIAQFVGFSSQHSSLVGQVRNLSTGGISNQYHCVYDDKFETVFGIGADDDAIVDDLINVLWTRLFHTPDGRDWYVEVSADAETGDLVYDAPPLAPEWLTEEEVRDREERLQRQILRNRAQRERFDAQFLPDVSVPDLSRGAPKVRFQVDEDSAFSDVGASDQLDDVDVLVEDPPSSSEGDGTPEFNVDPSDFDENDSSEGSVDWASRLRPNRSSWKNKKHLVNRLLSANSLNALSFTPAQLACLDDKQRSQVRSLFNAKFPNRYSLTLGNDRQVPIQVRTFQARKWTANKKSTRQRDLSDEHVRAAAVDDGIVPSVEDLLNSPLAQFIQLASNDCGYGGSVKELVANYVHPLFLSAKTGISSGDNPSWDVAMKGDEAEDYWEAMKVELATLEAMNAWDVVDRPKHKKVLPSLWAFRRKRLPDGTIRKHKARFTARGDKQIEGEDFNETYAPVVQWTTIRLMFVLQCLLNLESVSADVSCAFLHGTLPANEEIFVEMPRGFVKPGKVLKLKKSLYGLRQAPRCFWQYLTSAMNECGLKQSGFDPCLFIGEKVIAVAYVDDILFWSKDSAAIAKVMDSLREHGLMLEKESTAAGFLGVDIKILSKDAKGRATKMELTQTGLIDRIITNLGLDDKTEYGKFTPAESKPLVKDADGDDRIEDFSYAAVVGQLLYLSGHTRPDIQYAVNQCARYMFCPKRSHELALKRIGKYLKLTRKEGLILMPSENVLDINAYPDADFAGLYGFEKGSDPACVKSRTGFVILAANCPVIWKSTLQSKTALSTMEAEITALASCCKELFPIMQLAQNLSEYFALPQLTTTMNVTVHEDNSAALILAETIPPEFTPRSKFFHLETIWFREEIVKRQIRLVKVDTKDQLGDIFTKGLTKHVFEYLRKKLCGW